jgi:predicted nucleic acid-binding protein
MQGKYLFDASALFSLIQRSNIITKITIRSIYILHLTVYEVGNALWKEAYLLKRIKDPYKAAELIQEILKQINILIDPSFTDVIKLSLSRGLTFYDASYVYAAESMNMTLVTNDKQILRSSNNAISFKEFVDVIGHDNA